MSDVTITITEVVDAVSAESTPSTITVSPGTAGPAGSDGAGIEANSGAPVADGTVSGDLYIDTSTGNLYRWS